MSYSLMPSGEIRNEFSLDSSAEAVNVVTHYRYTIDSYATSDQIPTSYSTDCSQTNKIPSKYLHLRYLCLLGKSTPLYTGIFLYST